MPRLIPELTYARKLFLLATLPLLMAVSAIAVLVADQSRNMADHEISELEAQLISAKRQELQNYLQLARAAITAEYNPAPPDDEEAKLKVTQILSAMTYGIDGYFFVYDYDGTNLVAPRDTRLITQNWSGLADSIGTPVVDELITLARQGGGYHSYLWQKPSTGTAAQMISYELSMGLSLIGLILIMGSVNISEIVAAQSQYWIVGGLEIPKWNIFVQPLGFLIFLVAAFAETNRAPFDLAEAEPELVGGFHTEYTGLKFGLFFLGEYGNVIMMSAIMATLFFGGYNAPWIEHIAFFEPGSIQLAIVHFLTLIFKTFLFVFFFIWVRWSIPRFRYDQLMDLGWKVMFPIALGNTVVTALVLAAIEGF